jgi:5,10-methylene-tetrahydrofolate dehydrogenase/methenyl tetrahydrofolate cyclohydrolase
MSDQDWNNRRVWIIGASTGIGRATAELLLQRGATVGSQCAFGRQTCQPRGAISTSRGATGRH